MTDATGLRVGFLGAGLIATFHSKMLRVSGEPIVRAGVYDPDPERAERFVAAAGGGHVAASEDEVLDGCDAVYVCTWTSEHPRLVAAAAARGLAVFCEKPLAVDLAQAEELVKAVRDAGVVNQVGLILRRSPAFLLARSLIHDDDVGQVVSFVFRDDQFLPTQGMYASTWRGDRQKAGSGTLLEHSIHDVDLVETVLGTAVKVSADRANIHGLDGIEDVVATTMTLANGAVGTMTSIWHDILARPSLRRLEVFCERRHIVVEGDWSGPVIVTDADGTEQRFDGPEVMAAIGERGLVSENPDGAFVAAARGGPGCWPTVDTALRAHVVVDAIYRSCAAGRAIPIPAQS